MATYFHVLLLVTLCFRGISLTEELNGGFSVELIHRDSPKSPLYNPTETPYQRLTNAFQRSINRANHFYAQSKVTIYSPEAEIIPAPGDYIMRYSIGIPRFETWGMVDTGSDLIWTQCVPCDECYTQTDPMFDPSKSTTYQPIPCPADLCKTLSKSPCNSTCQYDMSYNDGSYSHGDLAFDTITIGQVSFPKIAIGCSHRAGGTFKSQESGIVGLGGGILSLNSQINQSIDFKFSYCLVPYTENNISSKISFGEKAVVSGPGTVTTPRAARNDITFYYLTLEAMSVGDKRLEFPPPSGGEGNIMIDSGTTITFLPEDFYHGLVAEVVARIKLGTIYGVSQQLSLCYIAPPNTIEAPVITAHFTGGADLKLSAVNTFISISQDVVCFAFASSNGRSIYGNIAQKNFLIGYDLKENAVSFKPTDCTQV